MSIDIDYLLSHLYELGWADTVRLFRESATYAGRGAVLNYVKEEIGAGAVIIAMQPDSGQSLTGAIVEREINGRRVVFFVHDPTDTIQNCHANGTFYEPEELAIIGKHAPPGGVFLDVGANVGNHSLYVAHFLKPGRVISVEPNPQAYRLLQHNVNLNGLASVIDTSRLGIGLSNAAGRASLSIPAENLGGARLSVSDTGTVPVDTGDHLLGDTPIHFIKIDTEAMELDVLQGLQRVIATNKPAMFVEVDDHNAAAFAGLLEATQYQIVDRHRRYRESENYMVIPR